MQHAYIDADLTDFPYIVFIDADTDIGAHALATGYDIRFTAADGVTLLSYERRSFTIAVGAATGRFVVKIAAHTAGGDIIYIHYGKAGASDGADAPNAYDADFKRVWALNESYSTAGKNYKDRKGVGNCTLTDADGDSAQGAGPIDKAVDLNGDADFLTDADHPDHDPGGAMTIEVWYNPSCIHAKPLIRHTSDTSLTLGWAIYSWDAVLANRFMLRFGITTASGTTIITDPNLSSQANWHYGVGTFDKSLASNRLNLYRNGNVVKSANGYNENIDAVANGIILGTFAWGKYDGLIADVRYSTSARSAAWIKFTYRNITETDHEQTWGAEEAAPTGPSIAVVQHHLRMMRGA